VFLSRPLRANLFASEDDDENDAHMHANSTYSSLSEEKATPLRRTGSTPPKHRELLELQD
jgi:hypothetical protein